jgi:TP901-1 family phage major tail protein
MAQATTVPFSGLKVMLESETTAGTFVAPCGLTERSFALSKETNDTTSIDCDNEDAAAYVDRDVVSKSATISGDGVLARESIARWRAAFESDEPVLARVVLSGTSAQGGGSWEGLFHLTSFEIGATRGERVTVSIEMQSSGAVAFSAAAA